MKKSIVRVLALVLMLTLVITSSAAALKLQKNDKSDNVRRLQQALTQLGYYSGTVDGSFGSGTKAAVSAFQQANSLTVDGIAGSATIALLEKQTGRRICAQAVGGAVGHNPVSIIVPCHRVIGSNGLTGYAGGLDKKLALLRLEGVNVH